ncbi:MAG: nucleotidyltransferase domain-containing protein [Thaumarchaeota archaeon]|nr:nucleotidyltransferase domain-containing protein [Nitrososphaerota archaeon]
MSHRILVKRALQRRAVFNKLQEHLQIIKTVVQSLDPDAEVYLFGSVAEGRSNLSSDIDILIVTKTDPATVHLELWRAGVKEPFEIHVHTKDEAAFFVGRVKLLKV